MISGLKGAWRPQRGVTLVELMIAMIIALLIAAAIGSLFVTSKNAFRLQSGTSAARETGGAIIEEVSREVRRAGNYGCFVARQSGGVAEEPEFLTTASLPAAQAGGYKIPVLDTAADIPRIGTTRAVYSGAGSVLPATAGYVPKATSEFLEFNYGEPVTFLAADMSDGVSPLQLGQSVEVAKGMPFLLATCTRMTLFRATNGGTSGTATTTLVHATPGENVALADATMYHLFSRGTPLLRLSAARLFVATSVQDGSTNLYREDALSPGGTDARAFAPNVLDMRVRLAIPDSATGVAWVSRTTVEANNQWSQVLGVQVHFVIAASETTIDPVFEMIWDDVKGFIAGPSLAPDRRPRRIQTITTAIRGRAEVAGS